MYSTSSSQRRLVRDYSSSSMFAAPVRLQESNHRDYRTSPQLSKGADLVGKNEIREEEEDGRRHEFDPDTVDRRSSSEPSISTQPTSVNGNPTARMTDFFSPEVYQIVLQNPTTVHQLKKFAQARLCGENLEFLEKIDQYHQCLNQVTKTVFDIHKNYISPTSPSQVNLNGEILVQINKNLKHLLAKTMPNMEAMFLTAQNDVQKLVASDIYPRFVRHQMTVSATRALATNKNKYAGLGDCFVLTDPNKADNPIVYASDGFVKVTGYTRNEIVPRNCRFLQTRQTDRESVTRIKQSLDNPAECVSLLLNERKNGEPFWNLLYTCPLYNDKGRLMFFLGGQIDVSTSVHSTSDVLRILSFDADDVETKPEPALPVPKSSRQSFFGTLRKSKSALTHVPGMEGSLVQNLQNMSFNQQKEAFYSAYSKFIVVNADTMLVAFHSSGVAEMLYTSRSAIQMAGQEVFKFLGQYTTSGIPREYKSRVKSAAKSGTAISLDLTLRTRRIMGYEQFLTHWTPLKTDVDAVTFLILTLGSLQDAR